MQILDMRSQSWSLHQIGSSARDGQWNPGCPQGTGRQQGVVLITTLVLLIVMMLIGVTAMQGTALEERMASNFRQQGLAFQAAEAALRAGEDALLQALSAPPPPYNGTWLRDIADHVTAADIANCNANTYWSKGYCWDGTVTIDCTTSPPTSASANCAAASQATNLAGTVSTGLSSEPRYVIERIFQIPGTGGAGGGSLCAGCPVNPQQLPQSLYRITARGTGGISDAVVILQTLVVQ